LHSSLTALVLRGLLQTLLTDFCLALYINSATVGGWGCQLTAIDKRISQRN